MTITYTYNPELDEAYAETCKRIVEQGGSCSRCDCPKCPGEDVCREDTTWANFDCFCSDEDPILLESATDWLKQRDEYFGKLAEQAWTKVLERRFNKLKDKLSEGMDETGIVRMETIRLLDTNNNSSEPSHKKTSWIKTTDRLPPEGKYVLARHNMGNWVDSTDQENVNCVVVKMKRGISKAEREAMPECERKHTYCSGDEYGNNKVPYSFESFGPGDFFGQDIVLWQPIESV